MATNIGAQQTVDPKEVIRPYILALEQAAAKTTDPATKEKYSGLADNIRQRLGSANLYTDALPTASNGQSTIDWSALATAASNLVNTDPGTSASGRALQGVGKSVLSNISGLQAIVGASPDTTLLPKTGNTALAQTAPIWATGTPDQQKAASLGQTGSASGAFSAASIGVAANTDLGAAIDTYIKNGKITSATDFYTSLYNAGSNQQTIQAYKNLQDLSVKYADTQYDVLMGQLKLNEQTSIAALNAQYKTVAEQYKKNAHDALYMATNEWAARGLAFSGMLNKAQVDIGLDYQTKMDQMNADYGAAKIKIINDMIIATSNVSLQKIQSKISAYSQYGLEIARLMDSQNSTLADSILKGLGAGSSTTSSTKASAYNGTDDIKVIQDTTGLYDTTTKGVAGLRITLTNGKFRAGDNKSLAQVLSGSYSVRTATPATTTKAATPEIDTIPFGSLTDQDAAGVLQYVTDRATLIKATIVWQAEHNGISYSQAVGDYMTANPGDEKYRKDVYAFIEAYKPYAAARTAPATTPTTGTLTPPNASWRSSLDYLNGIGGH